MMVEFAVVMDIAFKRYYESVRMDTERYISVIKEAKETVNAVVVNVILSSFNKPGFSKMSSRNI